MRFGKKTWIGLIVAVVIVVAIATTWAVLHYKNRAVSTAANGSGTIDAAVVANSPEQTQEPMPEVTPAPTYTPTPLDVQTPGKADADITDRLIIKDGERKAFLTFDDGPSENTEKILDILKQYDVKATFFVMGKNAECHPELIKRIFEEGHAIGNHSYNHNYGYMYSCAENFKEEVEKTTELIGSIIGQENVQKLFRFPGGSFEQSKAPYRQMLSEMGYSFADWNSLNGDADGKAYTHEHIMTMFQETTIKHEDAVVLMHDTAAKTLTVEALPECIEYLKNYGFTFEAIRVADGVEGAA